MKDDDMLARMVRYYDEERDKCKHFEVFGRPQDYETAYLMRAIARMFEDVLKEIKEEKL